MGTLGEAGGTEWGGMGFRHAAQSGVQFGECMNCPLLGFFIYYFPTMADQWVTETAESKTAEEGDCCNENGPLVAGQ